MMNKIVRTGDKKYKKNVVRASNNVVISQDEGIHEHNFISVAVKELNSPRVIKCITCGKHYFDLSGKALTDKEIDAISIEEVNNH